MLVVSELRFKVRRAASTSRWPGLPSGAGDGNRTRTTSLEASSDFVADQLLREIARLVTAEGLLLGRLTARVCPRWGTKWARSRPPWGRSWGCRASPHWVSSGRQSRLPYRGQWSH